MVATSSQWQALTGVTIEWEQRSLQDFESFPVDELARRYDLLVIDHPHVGQIARENCLVPLDRADRAEALAGLAAHSVGQSFASYHWQGHQWALPIDAAAQVQAYRPDLLGGPVTRWEQVVELAEQGRVLIPMRSPHALMSFYTLAANLGTPCAAAPGGKLIEEAAGVRVLELLAELMGLVRDDCWELDPIAALELLASDDTDTALLPLTYGYLSYATDGFRPQRAGFADIPAAGVSGPIGSALGGTGIAVSNHSAAIEQALDYAFWVAGEAVQKTTYTQAGGQAGHAAAWDDEAVNAPVLGFYRQTRATLEGAWVRPRHDGYMAFQKAGSAILENGLRNNESGAAIIAALNAAYAASLPTA
ncbi:carbohydrate ABC transporter substrate-binding protein [Devosia sp. A449]